MAHLHKKMKNGRPYYYVREMARINGQPKVVKQVYLGSPERILELVSGKESECTRISAEEFGSLWMAHLIDSQVGLVPPGRFRDPPREIGNRSDGRRVFPLRRLQPHG